MVAEMNAKGRMAVAAHHTRCACMNRYVFVGFMALAALSTFCTLAGGSSISPWNSVTRDAADSFSVDIPLDGRASVEFSVSSLASHAWLWSVNGAVVEDVEGATSQVSCSFDDYGYYTVTAVGTGEQDTVSASWNVTVWLVIGEENDLRELEGLEAYSLRIASRPERIVSLAPSCTELLFAVGAGDQVVGVTEYCDFPREVVEKKRSGQIAVIGGYTTPSLEKIVALKPDLIVGAYGNPDDLLYWLVDESAHRGITYPVYAQNPRTIEEILSHLVVLGAVTGCAGTATSLVEELRTRLDAVEDETRALKDSKKPRVYYTLGEFFTAGDGTFSTEVIELAGGRNIATGTPGYFVLNLEALVARNPQVIICDQGMGTMSLAYEEIMNDPRLQVVEAVKHGWVYIIDGDLMGRPGPRVVDAVELVHDAFRAFFAATRTSPEPSAGVAPGGGSSGKSTTTPQTALTPAPLTAVTKATRTIPSLAAGEEVTMLFEAMDIALLTLWSDRTVSDVVVVVQHVEKPAGIPDPPGIGYAYLSIIVRAEEAAHLAGQVEFKVAKSWLADNHIDEGSVTLMSYQEHGGWIVLPTSRLGEDNATVQFEAETRAFSVFAITGAVTGAEPSAPPALLAPTVKPAPTPGPETASTPAAVSETPGFSAVLTVAVLLGGAYLLPLQMKKRR